MKGYCAKCEKREKCKTLCAVCEAYANQDFVPIEEGLVNLKIENREKDIEYDDIYDENMSPRILKTRYKYTAIRLYEDGKTTSEIAYHIPLGIRQIQNIIKNYKQTKLSTPKDQ